MFHSSMDAILNYWDFPACYTRMQAESTAILFSHYRPLAFYVKAYSLFCTDYMAVVIQNTGMLQVRNDTFVAKGIYLINA